MKQNAAKRLLSLILALAAVRFLAAPILADSEQTSASVVSVTVSGTTTYYDSVEDAITALGSGNGAITLLQNASLGSKVTLSGTVIFDLGGYTLSVGSNCISAAAGANVTIRNGTISGTISGSDTGVIYISSAASVSMNGVTVESSENGVYLNLSRNISFTAEGCTFSSASGCAIYAAGDGGSGTVALTDCALSSAGNTLKLAGGSGYSVIIDGCSIISTSAKTDEGAIYLSSAKETVEITNTVITNENGNAIDTNNQYAVTAAVALGQGNYVTGTINIEQKSSGLALSISGGYFSAEVEEQYLTTGCSCIQVGDGTYRVVSGQALTLTYSANGGSGEVTDSGVYYAGDKATIASGDALTLADCAFTGWNTASDGSGTDYAPGSSIEMAASITLYAQWTKQESTLHIYNNMILSSALTYNFLIRKADLESIAGYTLTVNGAALALQEGEAGTIYEGYWVGAYNFYACDYDTELTVVLTCNGASVQTEVSYTSAAAYLESFADDETASEAVKTMASAAVDFCKAAKAYYTAQTGSGS